MILQHLILENFGDFLGKHSERLIVTDKDGNKTAQAPLMHLESVMIAGSGIGLSADAVRECAERGIPIHFVSKSGSPYASLYASGLGATVQTRRAQMLAFGDARGLHIAINIARGKIKNQSNLLRYAAKYRKETAPAIYEALYELISEIEDKLAELDEHERMLVGPPDLKIDDVRGQLLSIEGRAAHKYWEGVKLILPESYAWPGRQGRGAKDPINAALNYGYGVLYGQVERALVLAGLDPYAGFMHVDRPGKPSLVLDFIEEVRQPIVDRTVLGLANKNVAFAQDERGYLEREIRKRLAEKVLARLESAELFEGQRLPMRAILQTQARRLAQYLRGERPAYAPFVSSW
jgi:CRISPR-associated protein Cas1